MEKTTDEEKPEMPGIEMEIKLPRILPSPITLADGSRLAVGDLIEHATFGKGTIVRLALYEDEPKGPFVYVDFENGEDEIIDAYFVRKLDRNNK